MKETSNKIKNKGKIISKKFKNPNIFVFLLFVLISLALWLLNYINKEHSTTIKLSYQFYNLPDDIVLSKQNPLDFNIEISGYGYTLIKESFKQKKLTLQIDFAKSSKIIHLTKLPNDKNKKFILSSELSPFINNKLDKSLNIIEISPDSIFFDIIPKQ
ncbi:MAG: hypothetical protein GX793_03565 [Bacteroidales bacterium]|jgi:hypothetical protein|nr:hypothetical protein [Bacteroidales bacterium]MCK9498947.1 hypothetical protein [Bacteroidales bacterium]MDY0313466.1 hypothetical protein [Bacteroidales bacterium]NLB86121.1 hypothetical protein [Bacteroidales bacterium]